MNSLIVPTVLVLCVFTL